MTDRSYTAEISKGQGLIEETAALLRCWQPGMSVVQLKQIVRSEGVINRATALRVDDIVGRIFAARFLVGDAAPARHLKILLESGLPIQNLTGILFLYAARAHAVFYDFIIEIYWAKYSAGSTLITKQDAIDFIQRAKNVGLINPPWSASTTDRIARYLGTALMDFGLASQDHGGRREILTFRIDPLTALYLAHELHFRDISDDSVLRNPDWRLFGFDNLDVKRELDRISNSHFIVQSSGELTRISWKHKTMEEALHAFATKEL